MAVNSDIDNQFGSFTRSLVKISSDMGKIQAGNVDALSTAYASVLATARRWAKDNQSARVFPEIKDGTARAKVIDFTGDNADKLAEALRLELDNTLSDRDWELFSPALTVNKYERKYNTIRANLDKTFLKKFDNRFKEAGAEVRPLGDAGMVEIAIPEGARWDGSGKNHNRRVDAWASLKKAVSAEWKRAAAERAENRQYLTDGGVDPDKFESMPPREQKAVLGLLGKTYRNKTLVKAKDARHALVLSEIDKARALTGELDSVIFNDPLTPLPDADVRKLSPEASVYRRLYRRAEDSERLLNSPEEIKRIRTAELKKRAIQKQAELEYYSNPANKDDPYYWERIKRQQKIMNREDLARYREAERTPGTPEFKGRIIRDLKSAESRQEAIDEFVRANPKSRLARARRERDKRVTAAKTRRKIGGAVRLARNAATTLIKSILVAVGSAVGALAKIQSGVMDVANTLRRRSLEGMTYNLDSDSMDRFEAFARSKGMKPELLSQALGGVMGKWSDATLYQDSAINKLAIILTSRTKDLFSMATAGGVTDPSTFLNTMIMDVAEATARGRGVYKEGIEADQAFSMNYNAFSMVDRAQADLFKYYWEAFEKSGYAQNSEGFKLFTADKEKGGTFDEWWRKGGKKQRDLEEARKLKTPAATGAADELRERVTHTMAVLNTLKDSVFTRLSGKLDRILTAIEITLLKWFGQYIPTIAAEVKARGRNENATNLLRIRDDLKMDDKKTVEELAKTGFKGGLEEFRAAYSRFKEGDILAFGRNTDMGKMASFIANYGSIYDIRKTREGEIIKQQALGPEKEGRVGAATANMIALESANQALSFPLQLERAWDKTRVTDNDPYYGSSPLMTSAKQYLDRVIGTARFHKPFVEKASEELRVDKTPGVGVIRKVGEFLGIVNAPSGELAKKADAEYKKVFDFLYNQYGKHGEEPPAALTDLLRNPVSTAELSKLYDALKTVGGMKYAREADFVRILQKAQHAVNKWYAQKTVEFEDMEEAANAAVKLDNSPDNNAKLDQILLDEKAFYEAAAKQEAITALILGWNEKREEDLVRGLIAGDTAMENEARSFVRGGNMGSYRALTPEESIAEVDNRIRNRKSMNKAQDIFSTTDAQAAYAREVLDAETRNILRSEINKFVGGNIESMLESGHRVLVDINELDTAIDRNVELKLYLNDKLVKTASLDNKHRISEDIWINDLANWRAWATRPDDTPPSAP
jgi:hypothetical protein